MNTVKNTKYCVRSEARLKDKENPLLKGALWKVQRMHGTLSIAREGVFRSHVRVRQISPFKMWMNLSSICKKFGKLMLRCRCIYDAVKAEESSYQNICCISSCCFYKIR